MTTEILCRYANELGLTIKNLRQVKTTSEADRKTIEEAQQKILGAIGYLNCLANQRS